MFETVIATVSQLSAFVTINAAALSEAVKQFDQACNTNAESVLNMTLSDQVCKTARHRQF